MKNDRGRQIEITVTSLESDIEMEHGVRAFLAGLKVPGLKGVTVDVAGGVATVGGSVNSFHEKQLATRCCQRVPGVVRVDNQVRVEPR